MKNYFVLIISGLCLVSACGGGPSGPPPPPPNLQLSPASLDFGVWVVGTAGTTQVETLTNTGGSDVTINNLTVSGTNAEEFSHSSTCGSSLGAGGSCAINVTFTPSQIGQRSATLTVSDDGVTGPKILPLNGKGGEYGTNATLSAASLTFGTQDLDTSSATQAITLSNYGTVALNVASVTASSDFGETDNCQPSVASGASCTINVGFAPSQSGPISGTLSINDDAKVSAQVVTLSGTGSSTAGACIHKGGQCYPGHSCCAGLRCIPASTRAFCE